MIKFYSHHETVSCPSPALFRPLWDVAVVAQALAFGLEYLGSNPA